MDLKLWKNICFTDHVLDATVGKLVSDWKTVLVIFFCFLLKRLAGLLLEVFVVCALPSYLFIYF